MLNSIAIENFRSCNQIHIRLGEPVIALLGKNGAGKTNVLHAIQLAADMCVGEPKSMFGLSAHNRQKPTKFELEFSEGGGNFRYSVKRSASPIHRSQLEEKLELDGKTLFHRKGDELTVSRAQHPAPIRVPDHLGTLFLLTEVFPPHDQIHKELTRVSNYLRAVHYYALPQQFQEHAERSPTPFVDAAMYDKWKASLEARQPNDSVTIRLLHMHLTKPDKLNELLKLVGEDGLGLISEIRIEEVKLEKHRKPTDAGEQVYSVTFVPCESIAGAGRPFRYTGLSAGTWRVIRLLTYLVFDESSCMLVEQPEDSIHTGLLGKLIDLLRTYSDRTQLICTTHSPRVMNLVGASGIRVVTADHGRTEVSELSQAEIDASQVYLQDEGTLAEYLETL
ncbi:MAG: AAA family ATPase [Planctomycetes bacterium]|nr:AAA family ATPase [Planctomycetota bacterium]